jgi:hypothetical protein
LSASRFHYAISHYVLKPTLITIIDIEPLLFIFQPLIFSVAATEIRLGCFQLESCSQLIIYGLPWPDLILASLELSA